MLNRGNYKPGIGENKNWKRKKIVKHAAPQCMYDKVTGIVSSIQEIFQKWVKGKIQQNIQMRIKTSKKNKFLAVKLLKKMIVPQMEQNWRMRKQSEKWRYV